MHVFSPVTKRCGIKQYIDARREQNEKLDKEKHAKEDKIWYARGVEIDRDTNELTVKIETVNFAKQARIVLSRRRFNYTPKPYGADYELSGEPLPNQKVGTHEVCNAFATLECEMIENGIASRAIHYGLMSNPLVCMSNPVSADFVHMAIVCANEWLYK